MPFIDYYKVLEIDKKATEAEIKKAYRKMARKYHPDLNPNDKVAEQKFKELNEANEVLSNPENRKKYDQHGENWEHADEINKQQSQQRQYSNAGGGFGNAQSGGQDYSDFFESVFGAGGAGRQGGGQRSYKGQDFNAELQLDLRDVFEDNKRTLTVNGKNIRLTIPAGVENGQIIKISGHGADGQNGGPKGDLYITFTINNDSDFKRDKANLYSTVVLDIYTAVLGGDITIPTFDGKVKFKVAPGTQNGTQIKLKGKGFPVYKKDGQFGDLFVSYNIAIPTTLTEKQKELFTELSKT